LKMEEDMQKRRAEVEVRIQREQETSICKKKAKPRWLIELEQAEQDEKMHAESEVPIKHQLDALASAPAEVEEDLPQAPVFPGQSPAVTQPTNNKAPVNLSRSSSMMRPTDNEASTEAISHTPLGARRPSYEALNAAAVQWPSMSLPAKGSRYTPPEKRDAAAELAQATWNAAHKAATVGPSILAPVNQCQRLSLSEAMRLMPDLPSSRQPTLLSLSAPSDAPRIQDRQLHTQSQKAVAMRPMRPSSARIEADWQANTVMHVRRARVVCQEAQSKLMRIGSQEGPVHSRLYDDHLNRMDRSARHKAKVRPLSGKYRLD